MDRNVLSDSNEVFDHPLIAASSLLLGAKGSELDERIPFFSKLKKYTGISNTREEIKNMEVYIAETLDWEIQKTNFFTFVEYYLSAGLICPEDRISKAFMNELSLNGIDSTVRGLVKEETS